MQKKYTILFYINLCFTERELIQNVGYKCFEKTSCKEKKGDGGNCYTKRRDTQITRQLQISCHLQISSCRLLMGDLYVYRVNEMIQLF